MPRVVTLALIFLILTCVSMHSKIIHQYKLKIVDEENNPLSGVSIDYFVRETYNSKHRLIDTYTTSEDGTLTVVFPSLKKHSYMTYTISKAGYGAKDNSGLMSIYESDNKKSEEYGNNYLAFTEKKLTMKSMIRNHQYELRFISHDKAPVKDVNIEYTIGDSWKLSNKVSGNCLVDSMFTVTIPINNLHDADSWTKKFESYLYYEVSKLGYKSEKGKLNSEYGTTGTYSSYRNQSVIKKTIYMYPSDDYAENNLFKTITDENLKTELIRRIFNQGFETLYINQKVYMGEILAIDSSYVYFEPYYKSYSYNEYGVVSSYMNMKIIRNQVDSLTVKKKDKYSDKDIQNNISRSEFVNVSNYSEPYTYIDSRNLLDINSYDKLLCSLSKRREINSAGGCEVSFDILNMNSMPIKYIIISLKPYNEVGDVVKCRVTGRSNQSIKATGFIEPNQIRSYSWEPIWYNATIAYFRILSVVITYSNNNSITLIPGDKRLNVN